MSKELEEPEIDPRIVETVWKGLGTKSLRAIADETGLSRDQVIRLREELLDSVDVLSEQQARTKLLIELESMVYDAKERAEKAPAEFYAGMINAAVGAIKAIQAERNRMSKENKDEIERLNQMRIRELLRLIDTTVARTLETIAQDNGLDADELFQVFQDNLKPAAQELEAK